MVFIKEAPNQWDTPTSHHVCDTCGCEFTVTPSAKDKERWDNCMADECTSYDPDRDADILFMSDQEIAEKKKIVSMEMLKKRAKKTSLERNDG